MRKSNAFIRTETEDKIREGGRYNVLPYYEGGLYFFSEEAKRTPVQSIEDIPEDTLAVVVKTCEIVCYNKIPECAYIEPGKEDIFHTNSSEAVYLES